MFYVMSKHGGCELASRLTNLAFTVLFSDNFVRKFPPVKIIVKFCCIAGRNQRPYLFGSKHNAAYCTKRATDVYQ